MDYLEKNYSDIEKIDETGIIFQDGVKIVFSDCIGRRYDSKKCIAERDITALPPYFEFFTTGIPVRILFAKTGLFARRINKSNFIKLQMQIISIGYSTYDLS